MLFPTIKKVDLKKDELVIVHTLDGKTIDGFVVKTSKNHFWLKKTKEESDENIFKFSFSTNHIIKVN